jgi:trimethylamine:corrinoid methyltransferase-like protein
MRLRSAALTTLLAATSVATTVSVSHAQNCQELWVERNQYYKEAGYCFRTPRAIRYFGNAGCRYDDEGVVPLPRGVRNRIAVIAQTERRLGCSG